MKKIILFTALIGLSVINTCIAQTFEWAGRYGGDGEDVVTNMYVDASGNTYATGYYTLNCDFDISAGENVIPNGEDFQVYVSKTNADGAFVWAKSLGSELSENGTAITADASGNVYVTGVFQETADFDPGAGTFLLTSSGDLDIFVVKLDPTGNFVWARSFGGTGYEQTNGIGTDANGNIYLSGYFYEPTDFAPGAEIFTMTPAGSGDGFVVKLTNGGAFVWAKQVGGAYFDLISALKVRANGDTYITGNYSTEADLNPDPETSFTLTTGFDHDGVFLLHLNADGGFVSAFKVAESDFHMYGLGLDVDGSGNAYISGYFGGNADFILPETTLTLTSQEFFNGYIAKIKSGGGVEWAKYINASGGSESYSIAVNSQGEVLSYGFFAGTLTIDSATLTQEVSGNFQQNYLAKFDAGGNVMSAYQFGGCNFIDGTALGTDQNDNIYLSAAFENTVDLNPIAGADLPTTSAAYRDNFLIKLSDNPLSTPDHNIANLVVSPNPTNGLISVFSVMPLSDTQYTIVDMTGKQILTGALSYNQTIDLSVIQTGVYVLNMGGASYKIVKE